LKGWSSSITGIPVLHGTSKSRVGDTGEGFDRAVQSFYEILEAGDLEPFKLQRFLQKAFAFSISSGQEATAVE